MKRLQLGEALSASAIAFAGCFGTTQTAPVNFDFSRTNYGFITSGGYAAGSFLAWDREQDERIFPGRITGLVPPDPGRGLGVVAAYAAGLESGGEDGNDGGWPVPRQMPTGPSPCRSRTAASRFS